MIRYSLTLFVAAMGGLVFAQGSASSLFSELSKDFGATARGPVHTHYFTLKNTTNETIILGTPRVSCGCVSASVSQSSLAPGESGAVIAMMDSKRIPQANIPKTVTVFVSVQVGNRIEEVQLRVTGTARDDLVIAPDQLAFGTVRKGQGGQVTTKLTFYSDPYWKILNATSSGAYVKVDLKALPAHAGVAGVSYEITATLDADCPVGNWMADIWVKTSAPGLDKVRLPVTVNVVNPIDMKPESITFGNAVTATASDTNLMLTASQPFKILEIKGTDDELIIAKLGEVSRPVHILKLTYTAKKPGNIQKTLEIVTDHPEQKTIRVPVTGVAKSK